MDMINNLKINEILNIIDNALDAGEEVRSFIASLRDLGEYRRGKVLKSMAICLGDLEFVKGKIRKIRDQNI